MWRFLRNRRLILRLHYYLGTHILGASRGGPCDSTALVDIRFDIGLFCGTFWTAYSMRLPCSTRRAVTNVVDGRPISFLYCKLCRMHAPM